MTNERPQSLIIPQPGYLFTQPVPYVMSQLHSASLGYNPGISFFQGTPIANTGPNFCSVQSYSQIPLDNDNRFQQSLSLTNIHSPPLDTCFDEKELKTVNWEELKQLLVEPIPEDRVESGLLPDGRAYAQTNHNLDRDKKFMEIMIDHTVVPVDKLIQAPRLIAINTSQQDLEIAVSSSNQVCLIELQFGGHGVRRIDGYPGSALSNVSTSSVYPQQAISGQFTFDSHLRASTSPGLYPVGIFAGLPNVQPTTQNLPGVSTSGVSLLANNMSINTPHGYYTLGPAQEMITSANLLDPTSFAIPSFAANSVNTNNSAAIAGNLSAICSTSMVSWPQQSFVSTNPVYSVPSSVSVQAQRLAQNQLQGKFSSSTLLNSVEISSQGGYPASQQFHAFTLAHPSGSGSYANVLPQHLVQQTTPAHILNFVGHPLSAAGHPHILQPLLSTFPLNSQNRSHLTHPGHMQHQSHHISPSIVPGQPTQSNVATNSLNAVVAAMTAMTVAAQQQQQLSTSIYHQQANPQGHLALAPHPGHTQPGASVGQFPHALFSTTFQQQNPHAAAVAAAAFYHVAAAQQQQQQQYQQQVHAHQPLMPSGQSAILSGQSSNASQSSNLPPFFTTCLPPPLPPILHQSPNQSMQTFHQTRNGVQHHSQNNPHHHQQQQQQNESNAVYQFGSNINASTNVIHHPVTCSYGPAGVSAVWIDNTSSGVDRISPAISHVESHSSIVTQNSLTQSSNAHTETQHYVSTPDPSEQNSCVSVKVSNNRSTPGSIVGSASTGYSSGGSNSTSRLAVSVPASPSSGTLVAPIHSASVGGDSIPHRYESAIIPGIIDKHSKNRISLQLIEQHPVQSSSTCSSLDTDGFTDILEPASTSSSVLSCICTTPPPLSISVYEKSNRRSVRRAVPIYPLSINKCSVHSSNQANVDKEQCSDSVSVSKVLSRGNYTIDGLTNRLHIADDGVNLSSVVETERALDSPTSKNSTNSYYEENIKNCEFNADNLLSVSNKSIGVTKKVTISVMSGKSTSQPTFVRQNESLEASLCNSKNSLLQPSPNLSNGLLSTNTVASQSTSDSSTCISTENVPTL